MGRASSKKSGMAVVQDILANERDSKSCMMPDGGRLLELCRRLPQFIFRPSSRDAMWAGLSGPLEILRLTLPKSAPQLLFRRFIQRTALPLSVDIIDSPAGGETIVKGPIISNALRSYFDGYPAIAERVHHLMCFAGTDDSGNPTLLNTIKPVFHGRSPTPLLMKTGGGGDDAHLVLNRGKAAELLGGFSPLSEQALKEITGYSPHAVNFLLSPDRYYQNADLRCVFDPAIYRLYAQSPTYTTQFCEVPNGNVGDRYSVIVPLESLLAFAFLLKESFPHLEVKGSEQLDAANVGFAFEAISHVLSAENIGKNLKYNEKRPVMAGFGSAVGQLANIITEAAPYVPADTAKKVAANFVRHFFAVEHDLIVRALNAEADELPSIYQRLSSTEFGRAFLPLESFEVFQSKVATERTKKQPAVPFEFSAEVQKSDIYLKWNSRIAAKFPHAFKAVWAEKDTRMSNLFEKLSDKLVSLCLEMQPEVEEMASVRNACDGFIELLFDDHKRMLAKIKSKIETILDPQSNPDKPTSHYWAKYWEESLPIFRQNQLNWDDAQAKEFYLQRAIIPDAIIFYRLPFVSQLFGSTDEFIEFVVEENMGSLLFLRDERLRFGGEGVSRSLL